MSDAMYEVSANNNLYPSEYEWEYEWRLETQPDEDIYLSCGFDPHDVPTIVSTCHYAPTGEIVDVHNNPVASGQNLQKVLDGMREVMETYQEARSIDPSFPKTQRLDLSAINDPKDLGYPLGKYGPLSSEFNFVKLSFFGRTPTGKLPRNPVVADVRLASPKGTSTFRGEIYFSGSSTVNRADLGIETSNKWFRYRIERGRDDILLVTLIRHQLSKSKPVITVYDRKKGILP